MFAPFYLGLFALFVSQIETAPSCSNVEIFTTIGSTCTPERSCNNPHPETDPDCTEQNNREMCKCIAGYIRDGTVDNKCIPESECVCPNGGCGENEFCNLCDMGCEDEPTCERPLPPPFTGCKRNTCDQKCQCEPGYIRDSDYNCVLLSECPNAVCGENEILNTEATSCDILQTCETPTFQKAASCRASPKEFERCDCIPGYVRNKDGKCVPYVEECLKCGVNEVATHCVNCCLATCQHPPEPDCEDCIEECEPGCDCAEGFTRDEISHTCVAVCPPKWLPHLPEIPGHPHLGLGFL
ncbi:unnamed protein product [Phyllotreta striolata]|uniref:TIL domain-containing protein n=1 Tax=Phyllotreta striolata TaxID=444603 RepID=A0A9N9XPE4_PHYSR|nr:unnamed protein product [Phyllotreta striolata]